MHGDRPPSRARTLTRLSPPPSDRPTRATLSPGSGSVAASAVGVTTIDQSQINCPDCAGSDPCSVISAHRDPYRRAAACSAPDLLFTISSNCSAAELQASTLLNLPASGGACADDAFLLPVCEYGSYAENSCECRLDDDVTDDSAMADGTGTRLLTSRTGYGDGTFDHRLRQVEDGGGNGNEFAPERKPSFESFGNWIPFGRTANTSV